MAKTPTPNPSPSPQRKPTANVKVTNYPVWIALAVLLIGQLVLLFRKPVPPGAPATDKAREYVGALVENQLYDEAAAEYERLLAAPDLDDNQRANLCLIVADMYKDEAHDYAKALTYYLRLKHLHPKSKLADEVGPQVVECLERLGRSLDAQIELAAQTELEPGKTKGAPEGKAVVARIGQREITYDDLEKEIRKLPDYLRSQFDAPEKKLEFLQSYLATELMYDKAKRLNLDKNPEIVEGAFQVKKSMMVQKLLEQEVQSAVKVTPEEVKLYYEAHKERYRKEQDGKDIGQKTLAEASAEVEADLRREREQQAQQKMLQELMTAQDVQLYTDLFPRTLKVGKGGKAKP